MTMTNTKSPLQNLTDKEKLEYIREAVLATIDNIGGWYRSITDFIDRDFPLHAVKEVIAPYSRADYTLWTNYVYKEQWTNETPVLIRAGYAVEMNQKLPLEYIMSDIRYKEFVSLPYNVAIHAAEAFIQAIQSPVREFEKHLIEELLEQGIRLELSYPFDICEWELMRFWVEHNNVSFEQQRELYNKTFR